MNQIPDNSESPQQDKGLIAVPITRLYDHCVMVSTSDLLQSHLTKPFIAINPFDAQTQKTTDGMTVNVSVNGASALVLVIIDDNVPVGTALVPRNCGIPVTKPERIVIRIAEPFSA